MIIIRILNKGVGDMVIFNKIALSFVVFFSFSMILNTYLGEKEKVQSNVIYFVMNGFAYIVSALEVEKEKQSLETVKI
jgi:hypothetical protein